MMLPDDYAIFAFSVTAAVSGMTGSVYVQRMGWWVQDRRRGEGVITRRPLSRHISLGERLLAPDLT